MSTWDLFKRQRSRSLTGVFWLLVVDLGMWDVTVFLRIRQSGLRLMGWWLALSMTKDIDSLREGWLAAPLVQKPQECTWTVKELCSYIWPLKQAPTPPEDASWKTCQSNSRAGRSFKVKQPLDMTYALFWQEARNPHKSQRKISVVRFLYSC